MPDNDERQQQILDAAAAVIIRLGYDKTTMGDIAEEAGASCRTIYLYFNGKEELFEALLYREYMQYAQTWLEQIEADPRGGTVGGFYRALFYSVNSRPLIAAMLRRDRRVIGNYLRKRDNLFAQMYAGVNTVGFFQALQAAGAIRQDIDASVILHIVEMLSYGQLTIGDFKAPDQFPPYDAVMQAIADMMDRALQPPHGGARRWRARPCWQQRGRQSHHPANYRRGTRPDGAGQTGQGYETHACTMEQLIMTTDKIQFTKEKETMLMTLNGRAVQSQWKNPILRDPWAEEAMRHIDYDISKSLKGVQLVAHVERHRMYHHRHAGGHL